jgi:hypothetical protein
MITGVEKRQVFDLPEPRLTVTEHQAMIYRCAHCRGQTTASFPEGVISAARYGPRVRAASVYLNVQQLIPEDRVAQAMADLFGAARLCPDSVVAWGKRQAEDFKAVAARIAAATLLTLVLRALIKRCNAIVRRGLAFHRNQPPLARQTRGRAPHRPGHNPRSGCTGSNAMGCDSSMTSPSPSPTMRPSGICG